MADQPAKKSRIRWGRWFLLSMLVLVIGVILFHAIWGYRAQGQLDRLVARYRAAGEPTTPEDLAEPAIPDANNMAIEIRAAAALVDSKSDSETWRLFIWTERTLPLTSKERAIFTAVLKQNAAVLQQLDAAEKKTGVDWRLKLTTPLIGVRLPDLGTFRGLANLLAAAALNAHEQGDDVLALRRVHQLLMLARAIDHQPSTLVWHLVAVGVRALAQECVIQISPDLQLDGGTGTIRPAMRAQVKALLAELRAEDELRQGLHHAILGERVMMLDTANEVLADRINYDSLIAGGGGGGPKRSAKAFAYVARPVVLSNTRAILDAATLVAGALDEADWPAAKARIAGYADVKSGSTALHFWAQIMLPSYERSLLTNYRCLTDQRLAATALAIRAYAADHSGKLPASLAELVPAYLPAVLLDPFTTGKPLSYLPADPDPRIYSVSDNLIDDGGSDHSRFVSSGRWTRDDAVVHLRRQKRDLSDLAPELQDSPATPALPATNPRN